MGRKPDKNTPQVIEAIRKVQEEHPELRGQWSTLAAQVNDEGIQPPRGAQWSGRHLKDFCRKHRVFMDDASPVQSDTPELSDAKSESMISDRSDTSETTKSPIETETSDASEISEIKPPRPAEIEGVHDAPLPETWQRQIREMIRAEVRQLMELQTLQTFPTIPLPPERPKELGAKHRRKGKGTRVKVGITLDTQLFDRFEQERKRLGLSASGFADVVLWNFFGQPPMSYQVDEETRASGEQDAS